MHICSQAGTGHTRRSRKCPDLLDLHADLRLARETESNEWSDHGQIPENRPRVTNVRGVGNPQPCVEPLAGLRGGRPRGIHRGISMNHGLEFENHLAMAN